MCCSLFCDTRHGIGLSFVVLKGVVKCIVPFVSEGIKGVEFYRKTWSIKRQLPNSGAEAPNEVENRHMHLCMAFKNKLFFFLMHIHVLFISALQANFWWELLLPHLFLLVSDLGWANNVLN